MNAQKSLRLAATCALFAAATASAQNMLDNPNFEDGPVGYGATGWEAFGNVFTEADNGVDIIACEGSQVLKAFGQWTGGFNVGGIFQEFDALPGQEWSFRCTARHSALDPMIGGGAPDANWMVQKIAWFDAGGAEIGGVESTILDGTFAADVCHAADAVVGIAPEGTAKLQALILYLQPAFDGGAGQIDEAELVNLSGVTPTLSVSPDPPIGGELATVTARYMTPLAPTYLARTLGGPGETYVPQLDVTLDLRNPQQVGDRVVADSNGMAEWTLPVPVKAIGRDAWLQALQFQNKTDVLATTIIEAPSNLLVNPGFETGDLTGWEVFGQSGESDVTVLSGDNGPSEPGMHSAFMDNHALALGLTLKQSTAAGSARPGQVFYSFDLKLGEADVGGVFFVEIFAEQAGGGVIGQSGLLGNYTPADWTAYDGSFEAPVGTDFLTIQFMANTGGAEGSISTMNVDNALVVQ